jgi:hypothetical protein
MTCVVVVPLLTNTMSSFSISDAARAPMLRFSSGLVWALCW